MVTETPPPPQDLLVFLYLEGPYTRGIFRRSAGAKACRELRDRLDGGAEDAEVAHQSAFVIAAVLKDFLRNIPGSVLCVDLFHQWMEVMEGDGGEQRIPAVQRLLSLLPGENLLLLRHVVAVLHRIQGNAHDNQMNAFNLSVCIAPSMLWPPAPSSPEMEGEATKKVCELVRFLIENCVCVLGDGASLFRAFSQKSSGSDHGSDVSSFQMNDSSYDSLENELNDDPESPFREQLPLRDKDKPDSCSRDSVITLSDGEPDAVGGDGNTGGGGLLQLPPLSRQRRFSPAVRPPRGSSSSSSQGPRRLRRSSEPALALVGTPSPNASVATATGAASCHPPARKASYDAAMEGEEEEEEDEVFVEQGLARLQLQGAGPDGRQKKASRLQNGGRRKAKPPPPPPLRLDASCSSLSSPATSPTGSSLSSLDSAFSQYSTDYAVPPQSPRNSPPHWPPPPPAVANGNAAIAPPPPPPPRPPPHTGPQRERGPSLTQAAARDPPMGNGQNGHAPPAATAAAQDGVRPRSSSPPSYQQALLQLQGGRSPFFRGGDKPLTVRDLRQASHGQPPPPRGVFFGQNCTTLVLHRPKSREVARAVAHSNRQWQSRRCSDPRVEDFEQLFFAEESYV
ncbi:unnamed protein product [Menidia menidia]|uniref:(Atlantic silverside) hypothetical protein n=1 Tax=Menidia menidia TaxID=238744 RepID=A0A8S4A9T5_9TELE|nr:unnamed protein product [Menidia menidia]